MSLREKFKNAIITLAMLNAEGKKIAFVKGNRIPNKENLNSKGISLRKHGLVVPLVIEDADKVSADGLEVMEVIVKEEAENSDSSLEIELIDGVTLKPIPEGELENYVVILEGQHRYLAYLFNEVKKLGNKGDLSFIYPLNSEITSKKLLSQVNIATEKWTGGEFVQGAQILNNGEKLPLLDAILELVNAGYSLTSAAYWCTFKYGRITKEMLVDVMEGYTLSPEIHYTVNLERSKRLLSAARYTLKDCFLKHRYLLDFLLEKYEKADDGKKVEIMNQLESFLHSLEKEEAHKLESAKGTRGVTAREQVVMDILNELYNKRYQK